MRETFSSHENRDSDYPLPQSDPLYVLTSTRWVVEQGEYVWINREQVGKLCEQWIQDESGTVVDAFPWDDRYHFHDGTERTVNWLLLLDALNFCFWAEKDAPRWSIEYQGEVLNGYWAEAAALKRAVEEAIPLWDAQYLSTISPEMMAHIFRGTQTIPLFEQRITHTREVGRVLLEQYDGQFAHAVEKVRGSAVQLALLLAHDFPSFRDRVYYRNCEVHFLKRAQICVADLHCSFRGKQWGAFTDLAQLTAFADYKLPQVLRYYGVLAYDPALAERVDRQEPLQPGSEEEVEIRAATVWACELLRRALLQRGSVMDAARIDQKLWLLGQNSTTMRPYHRTRTIYY
jgi:hypothetical protein